MDILRVGTSAGGARAIAVIAWNEKSNELRCGQVSEGPGRVRHEAVEALPSSSWSYESPLLSEAAIPPSLSSLTFRASRGSTCR